MEGVVVFEFDLEGVVVVQGDGKGFDAVVFGEEFIGFTVAVSDGEACQGGGFIWGDFDGFADTVAFGAFDPSAECFRFEFGGPI